MTGYKSKRAAALDKLAQPAQEPVAWLDTEWGDRICPEVGYEATITEDHPRNLGWIPLYTTPPQRPWVGLTDDEIYKIAFALEGEHWRKIADAIEAKLKEKNNG
jgi:hypothetical protein